MGTVVNHVFNSAFDVVGGLPGGPLSDVLGGALVLVRRSLFFVPEGVSVAQTNSSLVVSVNSGSVAYIRQVGSSVQISGDPGFFRAYTVSDASAVSVSVSNAGNAGCAGVVVTSGTVNGALSTSGIDALRFADGAAFSGRVDAVLGAAALHVRDAVRGLGGVRLDAAVVLDSDVEVDAGQKEATFVGTVDAARAGWQSLTVTALTTTRFEAAVGGRAALAALLTRGIAPLSITESTDTKTIPLQYVPQYQSDGSMIVKYGIDVALGANAPRSFVFDTGGNGFWADYNPVYWTGIPLGDQPASITYTNGEQYQALVTPAIVTLGPVGGTRVSTTVPVNVGAIISSGKVGALTTAPTNPFAPTVAGSFAGDFGAAFGVQDNLTSVLFQLPGNLSSGYLVQLGPIGTDPQLSVGVTDALRAQFPYAIPINALAGGGTYPVSGYQVLQQFGFNGQYFAKQGDTILPIGSQTFSGCTQQCLPTLIDSGAPSTNIRLPGAPQPYPFDSSGQLTPGSTLIAEFPTAQGRPPLIWSFDAGNIGSVDLANYSSGSGAATTTQNVNTGLNIYNDFDVMFDLQNQVIWLRPNGGQSQLIAGSVTTTGSQTYLQNATLGGTYSAGAGGFSVAGVTSLTADTVINAGSGDVTFAGTVDGVASGQQSLAVNSSAATTFVRAVGSQKTLRQLTTDSGGTTTAAGATTTGTQQYGDDVTLASDYTGSAVTVGGATTLASSVAVTANSGDISFAGKIDSQQGQGFNLRLQTNGGDTSLHGDVGGTHPLGGIGLVTTGSKKTTVTADGSVNVDGSLGNSGSTGIFIGDNVTVDFANGGSIRNFTANGVVFEGSSSGSTISKFHIADNVYDGIQIAAQGTLASYDYTGTTISDNLIYGNAAFGIETVSPVSGLTISHNTIGLAGTSNPWNYRSDGPNTHGIVLSPGEYSGTSISENHISDNLRSGIYAAGGVKGVSISGNILSNNGSHGIEFATGDFSGTSITGNTIAANATDGISLGAGIGQGDRTGENPLNGYSGDGHYVLPYFNQPDFYSPSATQPVIPTILMQIGNVGGLTINLDTGSRGLYVDALQLGQDFAGSGTVLGPGHIYLNSSNRLYFGTWVEVPVTFTQSYYETAAGLQDANSHAVATVPVLAVDAIGASTTPMPGATQANTTFTTTINSGTITITDGTHTTTSPITPTLDSQGQPLATGTVTIPGGYWASYLDPNNFYDDNGVSTSKLAPVANFGVGFDRTGEGTAPVGAGLNQAYNAFLNLTEMQDGAMRPGYVMTTTNVILGLDSSVSGYAYTHLTPSGLPQGDQTAPDWQPATGTVTIDGTTYGTGPIVLDMGFNEGILTLPGFTPPATFADNITVNLLNSGGSVRYTITQQDGQYTRSNVMNPNSVNLFNPLAGAYSQNVVPLSQQFFNTGRQAFAGFNYLYDAAGGFLGLSVPDNTDAQKAFTLADGVLDKQYYPNPNAPVGVSNLVISGNTISDNGGAGISVNGGGSTGNAILANSIHSNTGAGIALSNGGNGEQPAPTGVTAQLGTQTVTVAATMPPVPGYGGTYTIEVFRSLPGDTGDVEGRQYLGTLPGQSGSFTGQVDSMGAQAGDWITLTATPDSAPNTDNTSEFSVAVLLTAP
ncbi:beta strand repeat-containing protein [Mycolicibacterium aichiense]|uniref:beta strand repeat-containing protein n=1 Tax=Mycolicibacterium aichiense TaxID=1799 RepID=UPI0013D50031|nr:right-handed parallel beta-helix repeat-containing protein [Mycolicibacterium aichiense]